MSGGYSRAGLKLAEVAKVAKLEAKLDFSFARDWMGTAPHPLVAASWLSPGKLCRWQLISVDQRLCRNISHATD
jgi:hypothetical protein